MTSASANVPELPASYATATVAGVADFVARHYALGPAGCTLLARGFNDVFALLLPGGERYVLRVGTQPHRSLADVRAETAFLAYLNGAGVPVAAAVPAADGALVTPVRLAGSVRPAVLFPFIEGRAPDLDAPGDAALQGTALARMHDAADRYPGREDGRVRLDLDHLVRRPLAAVRALGVAEPDVMAELDALGGRVAAGVSGLRGLHRTRCHGDCHGLNARIAAMGADAGQAVLFDFDEGGYGILAYDLAVHLWAQVSFGRSRYPMWNAFRAGYDAARRLAAADEAAIPLFVLARHIWFMGSWAGQIHRWGTETLPAATLRRELAWLRAWERDQAGPRLV